MRHISLKIITFFICLLLFGFDSKGQCAFEGDLIIEDQDTTSVPIIICGAENNNLATNNCLETVTLHFKHQFVGDLLIELVSPAGQKVTLVGPMATISPSTSLVTGWNVEFFASGLPVFPDPGYAEVWNSLQTWLGFVLYTGKYYPYDGMLEDFDLGSVDGEWTLNIIDNVQFGKGNLYCVDLTFCEEDGIDVKTCTLVEHTLSGDAIVACENDPILNISANPDFIEEMDSTIYDYGYVLFEDGAYHSILSDLDMTSAEAGDYEICGILYLDSNLEEINTIELGSTQAEFQNVLTENGLCASFSEGCLSVTIHEIPELVTEELTICSGETVIVGNTEYSETGTYEIITPMSPCDSTSVLELVVIDIEIGLDSEFPQLTCENPTSELFDIIGDIPIGSSVSWSTINGNITSNPDSTVIAVDQEGFIHI